jgi:hypothetical protein
MIPGYGLIGYAENEFKLNKRQGDGCTAREHLEKENRNRQLLGKEPPPQLEPMELPYMLNYLWSWFCDLSGGRGYAEFGPLPLSYSEIQAWAALTKNEPTAWEVNVLKQIDREFLSEAAKK